MERIGGDLGEGPTSLSSVRAGAHLDDVVATPAADLLLPVADHRVGPRDAPGLNRRIPRAQPRAKHVHHLVRAGRSLVAGRHDPDVLYGAALEHPSDMDL